MAAPPYTSVAILERHQVAPPQEPPTEQELILPLLHFDMIFLFSLIQTTLFYELPICSKSYFLETIVPRLKNSLSLSLKHYLPLAGNIIIPPATSSATPFARYVAGDSLCLTVAESTDDFHHLSGDHPRNACDLDALIPHLPSPTLSSNSSILVPAFAVQTTLFPNQGFCIGWTDQHSIMDGASYMGFLYAWASLNKYSFSVNGRQTHDDHFLQALAPCYDRTTAFEVPHELNLQSTYWNQLLMKLRTTTIPPTNNITTMRATFALTEIDIKRLKNFALQHMRPETIAHLSSFTVVCSHLWVCLAKLASTMEVANDELVYFACPIDCRALLNPSLPPNYFGNCVTFVIAEIGHATLTGKNGFVAAIETIGELIQKSKKLQIQDQNKVDIVFNPFIELRKLMAKRLLQVGGSPSFDVYKIDFGWGRMKKHDHISNGRRGGVSLWKSRDEFKGGVEISLNLPKMQMDSFAAIFNKVLFNGYDSPGPIVKSKNNL